MVLIKAFILLAVLVYIFAKIDVLKQKKLFDIAFDAFSTHTTAIGITFLLVFANWGIEALKWKISVAPIEKINFSNAFVGVLSGLNIGILLPQALGDYAGRIWHLNSAQRTDAISSVFLCHSSQFFITCFGGVTGAIIFYCNGLYTDYLNITLVSSLVCIVLFTVLLFAFKTMIKRFLTKFPLLVKNYHYLKSISEMELQLLFQILGLSLLRYFCFLTQFLLVLKAFEVAVPHTILAGGVMLVFFLKSIVPSFNFLADLGIREFSALAVFSILGDTLDVKIIAASLTIWFINLFIPSVLGAFTIFSINIYRKDEGTL